MKSDLGRSCAARYAFLAAWPIMLVTLAASAGCSSRAKVPPEEAVVELSDPRVERVNGEDQFLIDYRFTRGQPKRGWLYRLVMVAPSGSEYSVDTYMNETQLRGTISGTLSFRDAMDEPSKDFEARLDVMIGTSGQFKTISNKVSF